jgi:hypothetical protein
MFGVKVRYTELWVELIYHCSSCSDVVVVLGGGEMELAFVVDAFGPGTGSLYLQASQSI